MALVPSRLFFDAQSALIFTAVVTFVEVAFVEPSGCVDALFIINRCIDAIFVVDMVLQVSMQAGPSFRGCDCAPGGAESSSSGTLWI